MCLTNRIEQQQGGWLCTRCRELRITTVAQ